MQVHPLPVAHHPVFELEFCPLLGKLPNTAAEYRAAYCLRDDYVASRYAGKSGLPADYSITELDTAHETVYTLYVYDEYMNDYVYLISVRFTPGGEGKAIAFHNSVSDGRNKHTPFGWGD